MQELPCRIFSHDSSGELCELNSSGPVRIHEVEKSTRVKGNVSHIAACEWLSTV